MLVIDGYPIDVAITEEHGYESDVTEHPVEEGSDTSDNIRNKPPTVSFEGVVSDTPIGAIARDPTRQGSTKPSDDAFAKLLAVRDAQRPVELVTSLGLYTTMALKSLTFPRSVANGDSLRFRGTFQKITIAKNQRTTVKTALTSSQRRANRGTKPSPQVDLSKIKSPIVAEKRTSVLAQAVDWASGN